MLVLSVTLLAAVPVCSAVVRMLTARFYQIPFLAPTNLLSMADDTMLDSSSQ